MDRIAEFVSRHSLVFAVGTLLSAAFPIWFLQDLRIDNSIEAWLRKDSPEYRIYREFLDRFGTEEFMIVALELEDPLSDEALSLQKDISTKAAAIRGVSRVLNLPVLCRALRDFPGWREEVRSHPFLQNLLIGPEGRNAGLFVLLDRLEGPLERRRVVTEMRRAAVDAAGEGIQVHLAGTPVLSQALDSGSERSARLFLPVAVLVSLAALGLMLRNPAAVVVVVCAVGLSVVWTMGIMTLMGRTLNMVTVVLPALLFVLALSNGIHLASRFERILAAEGDSRRASAMTLQELIRPLLLSSITTAVGFASLSVSDMDPVRDLGLFAAIGILISSACNLFFVPGMLVVFSPRGHRMRHQLEIRSLYRSGSWTARHPLPIFLCAIVLLGGGVALATRLQTESNMLKFFPESSQIARDYAFVGDNLTGFYTLELEVRTSEADEGVARRAMRSLSSFIVERPEVTRVDYSDTLEGFFNEYGAVMPGGLPEEVLGLRDEFRRRFRHVEDGMVHLRMSILVRAMETGEFYELLESVRNRAKEIFPSSISWRTTGVVSLLNDLQRSLMETQLKSLSMAAVLVILMIGVLFKSFRVAAAAILPNLLPIFFVLGVMALTGIPLNPATVMIAGVAIGIAADDTIHFLARYREERRLKAGPAEATARTLKAIGSALLFTSVVAASGFATLCMAPFRPIVHFGLVTGLAMLAALGADVLLLPPCARLFRLWKNKAG